MTDVKLFFTCLLFSFIVGAYTAVLYQKDRIECTVEMRGVGNTKHVFTGRIYQWHD